MNAPMMWSRVLLIVGLLGMLIGAIDPLEGSVVILPSAALVALGGFLGRGRHRTLLLWSLALAAAGVAALFILSWLGGLGGNSDRSMWWAVAILPYPVGWVMGLVGGVLSLIEQFRNRVTPRQAAA
jgi:hypothetical protein